MVRLLCCFRPVRRARLLPLLVALCSLWSPAALEATDDPLGSARLEIAGTRLVVAPESQTVPFNTPTIVDTSLDGYDLAAGTLPSDVRVRAELSGPGIDGHVALETVPGEPLRIPRLSLEGEYWVEDIRLVQDGGAAGGDELLAYAEPRSAAVRVTQVLVTRVTSRAMTLDEIRSRGIVVSDDNFRAYSFDFAFAVDGEVYNYNIPVIDTPGVHSLIQTERQLGGSAGRTAPPRFRPPQMAPFVLEIDRTESFGDYGGCQSIAGCFERSPVSLPGVILFPTDVSLLNQFFSVVLVAKNDAPEGDPLVIRDLTAKVQLPAGLRMAETEPPTPLGVPVPVRVPGADGILGTADDITFLVAQAEGQAEVLVEGRKEGTHVVEFDLEGVLEGLPGGIERITGRARGAVVVRDPDLSVTIHHPEVVRADQAYPLRLTIANTGNAPAQLLTVSVPPQGLSGVTLEGATELTVPEILPGEVEIVEFQARSLRTGRVVASTVRADLGSPRFVLEMAVGEAGIPLSPTSIVLPESSENLPDALKRHALALVGLGFSVATAPAGSLPAHLPELSQGELDAQVYRLAQAGRYVTLGEDEFDVAAVLAAEWTGAREPDWAWDGLRRETERGALVGHALGQIFAAEAAATSERAAFERFAKTTAYLDPLQLALAEGGGTALVVESRTTGKLVAGSGVDPARRRELPFADLYDLGGGQMALLAHPEEGGYRVRMWDVDGGWSDLTLLVPHPDTGALRVVGFPAVQLGAAGEAVVEVDPQASSFSLRVDADGDGVVDQTLGSLVTPLAPRPFEILAAVQDTTVVTGHTIDVLFSRDVDVSSLYPSDPVRFEVPGRVSNGGLVKVEQDLGSALTGTLAENPFDGLRDTRIVKVTFNNPLSPYLPQSLTVRDVDSEDGATVAQATLPVQTTAVDPGGIVQGTVYGADGEPVPFARVELRQEDFFYFKQITDPCAENRTAVVEADADGRFQFDYVRQTVCSDLFKIQALDPTNGQSGKAVSRMRFIGETVQLDVVMLGRGTIRGRLTYDDGTVPEAFSISAHSPLFFESHGARVAADGTWEIEGLPVGTISLGATDRQGGLVFQTLEIPVAGAVVERDLVIVRRPAEELTTGQVRGTITESDGTTPAFDAYLALYVDGELVGVERSGEDGRFDFGTVPAGLAELEGFDGETGLSGLQVYFEIEPDQIQDLTLPLRDDRGTIEGHVYRQGPGGTVPVAGAIVWVDNSPFHTLTDASGFYRLEAVFTGGRQLVAADIERQEQVTAAVTVQSDGQVITRDLVFQDFAEGGLAGEVIGFNGTPVGGAKVHLAAGNDQWWKEVYSGPDGRFRFADLAPGTYEIHAIKEPFGGVGRATIRFEGDTPFATIHFERGTIRGRTTTIDGQGVETGVVSLVTYRTTVPRNGLLGLDYDAHTLETDSDGNFEIPDVLAGRYTVTVSNAFHGSRTFHGEVTVDGEVRVHNVVFQPSGTIRGTVFDIDGETPVPGAVVDLRHPSLGAYDLTTDADGRFAFEFVPPTNRRFALEVESTDGTVFRQAQIWVSFTQPGQELDVEMVLPEQGTVSGWVEDADGVSVPGAVVTLTEGAYPRRRLVTNADADGNWSFTNIFVGEVTVSAQAPALGGLGTRDTGTVEYEDHEVWLGLVLEGTGEIEGQVLSPVDGSPAPRVQLTLRRWGGRLIDAVTSDDEGRFRFRLLPFDVYYVDAFDPSTGRVGRSQSVGVETHGQVVDLDLTLEARGDVQGHLLEPSSLEGVAGATIAMYVQSLRRFTTYSSTGPDGFFDFPGIPEGTFRLTTREPGGRRRAEASGAVTAEGELVEVDLFLESTGRLVGTVLAPPGQPAGPFAGEVGTTLSENRQVVGAVLDGTYEYDGLRKEQRLDLYAYEVGGDRRGWADGRLDEEEDEITLDVQLRALGSVRVTVVESDGDPVAGSDVGVYNRGPYGTRRFAGNTDAAGQVTFGNVGEGYLSVSVDQPGGVLRGSKSGQLTQDGEIVDLQVVLEPSGRVVGQVRLSDGITPADEATVVLERGSRTLYAQVDETGAFELSSVPLGGIEVQVQERYGPGYIQRFDSIAADGDTVDLGTLVLDDHDPQVVELTPLSGSGGVDVGTSFVVRFSEPLDRNRFSWGWFSLRKVSGGGGGQLQGAWSEGDTVLTITPLNDLASFSTYELIVGDAVDPAGRRLSQKAKTVFTTADVVAPTVIDVLPQDGVSQVAVDSDVWVTFSEPVAFASLSGSAFQLTDVTPGSSPQNLSTTFVHQPGERQVLLTPVAGLQTDRLYQLTVQNVLDQGGNPMAAPVTTTFWTLDTLAPQASASWPGAALDAGDPVLVTVTATDERGLLRATLEIDTPDGELWSFPVDWPDGAGSVGLEGVAPVVSAATQVPVRVVVEDIFGNETTLSTTLAVNPSSDAVAPQVVVDCGRQGGWAIPGELLELGLLATDDLAVESLALFVDGVEIDRAAPLAADATSARFLWSVPAGASVGQAFAVQLVARDFAGTETAWSATYTVPAGTYLDGGALSSAYDGQTLILGAGEYEVLGTLSLAGLVAAHGAGIEAATGRSGITIEVAGEADFQCGSLVDVMGIGYLENSAAVGVDVSTGNAGGSHGGRGRPWGGSGVGGEVYDSVVWPRLPGGGGAGIDYRSSPGSGVVSIVADTVILDGELRARGGETPDFNDWGSGGAGGTVSIVATSLSGAGLIDASGGFGGYPGADCGSPYAYGAGGGGRVALHVDQLAGFDPTTQVTARGGALTCQPSPIGYGSAGTILVKTAADTLGVLHLDGDLSEPFVPVRPTELPVLVPGSVTSLDPTGADAWVADGVAFPVRWLGTWMILEDAAGTELGAFEVVELDETGRVRLAGAGSVAGAVSYRGEHRFDRIETRGGAGMDWSAAVSGGDVVLSGDVGLDGELVADTLTVAPGTLVTPYLGNRLTLRVDGALTIGAGAVLDVTGLGYPGGAGSPWTGEAPDGIDGSESDAGGSHGGSGRPWANPNAVPGEVYDSVYHPRRAGGGGGHNRWSPGGGVIAIEAGTMVLDGELRARGDEGLEFNDWRTGGAGGTVSITAASLAGSGLIDASGGLGGYPPKSCSSPSAYGSGGGGRVALWVDQLLGFDPATQTRARGGALACNSSAAAYAAPGTVLVKTAADTHGLLRIDQGVTDGTDVSATQLPPVGKGFVGAVETSGADLWIEPEDPNHRFAVGLEGVAVRIGEQAGAPVYEIAAESPDRRRLLLAGAAGLVAVGDRFVGLYRFDEVQVAGGATLELLDDDEIGTETVEPGSAIERSDITAPTLAWTAPAEASVWASGQTVTLSVDATDDTGVASVTFEFAGDSFVDTEAPFSWQRVAPPVTEGTDFVLTAHAVDTANNPVAIERTIRVEPLVLENPPVVSLLCPTPGGLLAPGTGLDLYATAASDNGIERVDLFVDSDPTPVATLTAPPYDFRWDAPAGATPGEVVTLTLRALSFDGQSTDLAYPVRIVGGAVLSADTTVAAGDTTYDGAALVVAGGTLTLDGAHAFTDLAVLDGAVVTHPKGGSLGIDLTGDLFVACGGRVDATGRGFNRGESRDGEILWQSDFSSGDLSDWTIVDFGNLEGPSDWTLANGVLRQDSNIRTYDSAGALKGTVAFLPMVPPDDSFEVTFRFRSLDDDGIGLVFGYDEATTARFRFYWAGAYGTCGLQSVSSGGGTGGRQYGHCSFEMGRWFDVRVVVQGPWAEVWIDGRRIAVDDDFRSHRGPIGFLSAANAGVEYDDVVVRDLTPHVEGGTHAGLGGSSTGAGRISGSPVDPRDPGAGGDSRGGGLVRIVAAGDLVVDGEILATGDAATVGGSGAGGSIRLDGTAVRGAGRLDASGGAASAASGSGGRIALYGATVDAGLVSRTVAAGGAAPSSAATGAAGTVFVRQDADPSGTLRVDNAGRATDAWTELLFAGAGVVDAVGTESITDTEAAFPHSVVGARIAFDGDRTALWQVTGHPDGGDTLGLDVAPAPLTAQPGDTYEGLYLFDRLIVGGGARLTSASPVLSDQAPEVATGASLQTETGLDLTVIQPTEGASFVAGETMTLEADAISLHGVMDVTYTLGAVDVVAADPFDGSLIVPTVASSQDLTLVVVARDRAGRTARVERTVAVSPPSNASPPTVSLAACPVDGDVVLPGAPVDLVWSFADDEAVESWTVTANGAVVAADPSVNLAAAEVTTPWAPPANAAAGELFVLRAEVRDYAGNVTVLERTFRAPAGVVYVSGRTLSSSLDGQHVALANGTYTVSEPLSLASLVVADGALVKPASGSDRVQVVASGEIRVQCGSTIDVTDFGYPGGVPGGAPSWVAPSQPDAGGSHGGRGRGWDVPETGGDTFDSVAWPQLAGGGAARDDDGSGTPRAGGGVIHLDGATVHLDGLLRADALWNDNSSYARTGGAGGTVFVRGDAVTGSGSITADGGWNRSCGNLNRVGAGGGGRVAIHAATSLAFDPTTQARAMGGTIADCDGVPFEAAAPGTLFVHGPGATYGDLRIDGTRGNGSTVTPTHTTELPVLGGGTVSSLTADGTDPADAWLVAPDTFTPRWVGTWVVLEDASSQALGGFEVLAVDGTGAALLAGAGSVTGAVAFRGEHRFDAVVLDGGASLSTPDPLADASGPAGALSLDQPVAGATFATDDPIPVQAAVDGGLATISQVTFRLQGQSVSSASPFAGSLVAPLVAEPTEFIVLAEAVDILGRYHQAWTRVTVGPPSNAVAPTVAAVADCFEDGDTVIPGLPVDLSWTFSDDELLSTWTVTANGVEVASATAVASSTASTTVSWSPPAGALAGELFTLRAEATDYAGNVGAVERVLTAPAGVYYTSGTTLDSSLDGQHLALGPGTHTVAGPLALASLTVTDGAILKPAAGVWEVRVTSPGDIVFQCGSLVDVTRDAGYPGGSGAGGAGGAPPGVAPSLPDAGGSHGGRGRGWHVPDGGGETFDSVAFPVYAGGGGAKDDNGGGTPWMGGGIIHLAGATVRIDGRLEAHTQWNDNSYADRTGGGGGTVFLAGDVVAGSGSITADGGWTRNCDANGSVGAGGGGRVAIHAATSLTFDPTTQARAVGGTLADCDRVPNEAAAPGTIYVHGPGATYGDLLVDGTRPDGSVVTPTHPTELPVLGSGDVVSLAADGADAWLAAAAPLPARWVGAWMVLEDASAVELGSFEVLELDGSGAVLLAGAATVSGAASYRGEHRFDTVVQSGGARLTARDWTVDVSAPAAGFAVVQPALGTTHPSYEPIPLEISVDPAVTVTQVSFDLEGVTTTFDPATVGSLPAPQVSGSTDLTLIVEAVDSAGRYLRVEHPVTIVPPNDGTAPSASVGDCPAEGDLVRPGTPVTLDWSFADDLGIASYTVTADGVELASATDVGGTTAAVSTTWTPPAATAGHVFTLRAEVLDYAGNLTVLDRLLGMPAGTVLSTGQSLDSTLDGSDLVLVAGTFTATEALSLASLTLVEGAVLQPATGAMEVDVTTTGDLVVQCGTTVDVTSLGFAPGTTASPNGEAPLNVVPSIPDGGGSHGGRGYGWHLWEASGDPYDSLFHPQLPGGGGAMDDDGSGAPWAGGGVIRLVGDTVRLDGSLLADGLGSDNASGGRTAGAGGTVHVRADRLLGHGQIEANGGWVKSCHSSRGVGSGGGGRVALWASTQLDFDPDLQADALGGNRLPCYGASYGAAAAGTVFVHGPGAIHGDLWLDAEGIGNPVLPTVLPAVGSGTVGVATADGSDPTDLWIEPQDPAVTFDLGLEGYWVRVDGSDYLVLDQTADLRQILLDGAAGLVQVGDGYQGVVKLDAVRLRRGVTLEVDDLLEATTEDVDATSTLVVPTP